MSLLWNAESLWEELEPLLPGLSIEVVPQTVSTNTTLLERARALGEDDTTLAQVRRSRESAAFGRRAADVLPCLLVAEHQTGGRGRMGRTWSSSRGASLTFSLSLPMGRIDWSGLSLAVGVALAEAIEPQPAAGAPRVGLKWPNDLWLLDRQTPEALSGRKLGGILIESTTVGRNRLAVIGVGLNVLPLPAGTPAELTTGYACLDELDPGISAPAALGRIARPLVDALVAFQRDGFPAFMERFAARDLLRGRAVTTTLAGLPEGVAQGIAPSGALLVLTPQGAVHDVASGEVSVRLQGAAEDAPC